MLTSTIVGNAFAKGLMSLSSFVGGTFDWSGDWSVSGFQSSLCSIAFATSVIVSDTSPQKFGFGAPPKVSQSDM